MTKNAISNEYQNDVVEKNNSLTKLKPDAKLHVNYRKYS